MLLDVGRLEGVKVASGQTAEVFFFLQGTFAAV